MPQSRGAILRFLHLGGDKIEFVGTLPAAEERPLSAGLGAPITLAEARGSSSAAPPPAPRRAPPRSTRAAPSVSLVFRPDGGPVLLSALRRDGAIC